MATDDYQEALDHLGDALRSLYSAEKRIPPAALFIIDEKNIAPNDYGHVVGVANKDLRDHVYCATIIRETREDLSRLKLWMQSPQASRF
jgi:hypothetical protein